jgi:hypothetical protein
MAEEKQNIKNKIKTNDVLVGVIGVVVFVLGVVVGALGTTSQEFLEIEGIVTQMNTRLEVIERNSQSSVASASVSSSQDDFEKQVMKTIGETVKSADIHMELDDHGLATGEINIKLERPIN